MVVIPKPEGEKREMFLVVTIYRMGLKYQTPPIFIGWDPNFRSFEMPLAENFGNIGPSGITGPSGIIGYGHEPA